MSNTPDTNTELVCTLTPETLRLRRDTLLPGLRTLAVETTPIADGYRLTFVTSLDVLVAIAQTIAAERECCRWLHFQMSVLSNGGATLLELTGPAGAQEFLASLFAA